MRRSALLLPLSALLTACSLGFDVDDLEKPPLGLTSSAWTDASYYPDAGGDDAGADVGQDVPTWTDSDHVEGQDVPTWTDSDHVEDAGTLEDAGDQELRETGLEHDAGGNDAALEDTNDAADTAPAPCECGPMYWCAPGEGRCPEGLPGGCCDSIAGCPLAPAVYCE